MDFKAKEFGEFVRNVRTASGTTVQQLAEAANGTAPQNISRIETGAIKSPSFDMVHAILTAINDMGLIEKGNIDVTTVHPDIRKLLSLYKVVNQETPNEGQFWLQGKDWGKGKSRAANTANALSKHSIRDIELGLAFVATMNEQAILKEELEGLWTEVCKNYSNPDAVDFSQIIHDLTERKQTVFYKQMNKGLKTMLKGDTLPQPYKLMILLLRALQNGMDNYGDKQHPEPSKRRLHRKEDIDF